MSLNDILDQVATYAPNADLDVIMRAWAFAGKAHAGQLRRSGEPYLVHPIAVAEILAQLRMDVDTIATGLLHDTMEDCLVTRDELAAMFGDEVADMVDGVTKIGKLKFRSKEEAQAENFRKMVLAMSRDVRVILVKLADRLHNMRTMEHMKPEKARLISQETLDIFVPIANRLGLSNLKSELEDLCFRYLHPDIYAELAQAWDETEPEREAYVQRTRAEIEALLTDHGMQAEVSGRPKHLYSIYKKMKARHLTFDQLHDLLAFRVIVDDIGACWAALGYIHERWRHRPGTFKDYITQPKSNGYQSLHTVVVGPGGQDIEIQIRTVEMHRINEVGIAAHWRYKEGHLALSPEDISKIARLRELWEAATDIEDPAEFLETVKVDLYQNEVYAFTPAGDVRFFPAGATVLDFAFAIHTEVGEQAIRARVNGRLVPLRTPLKSGDTVEIVTSRDQRPKREWLEWAHTGRALSKIRRYLREEERERSRELGRELLDKELRRYGTTLAKQTRSGRLAEVARHHGFRKREHLYLAIGQGQLTPQRIVREMVPELVDAHRPDDEPAGLVGQIMQRFRARSQSPVLINGESDVMVSYARCCNPLPGEPVAGYITRGHGISVHARDCPQLLALDPERRVPVEWHGGQGNHTGELNVVCADKPGMLADIGAACKSGGVNVTRMQSKSLGDDKALLSLEVAVSDVQQLNRLMRELERIKGVITVDRIRAS
ncbi:MAG: bifunctional (p)ppGpp synthetase/guanosine-3',5'-bis(diphosphate) 3'-pyrophosphohydrolase [Deltaproteobacteria bacterium]|nr:MAG: bifunctional (p)ppGpp synthetase/guanosine-3',5'-bis(diphosphate) 3'-pyrophosphohydrolase [Deltaproteobacteria bacterium]